MSSATTIGELLRWAAETLAPASPTPRLDAELLLAHALGWNRARVLAELRWSPVPGPVATFQQLVARRRDLEPVAYLVGQREFYGLDFVVDQRVLVPRPETELLVEQAIVRARALERPLIADICTGSGCIAVALAHELPQARIVASDFSPGALEVAQINVERHGVAERVSLLRGDLLEALPGPVDILVCNPPYTILAEIDEGVRRYEPHLALDGGVDGLAFYRRLLAQAPAYLRRPGALLLEIGAGQAQAVSALAAGHFPAARVALQRDLAGHPRVVSIDTAAEE
jgi:release factor glutamine methyltransferase